MVDNFGEGTAFKQDKVFGDYFINNVWYESTDECVKTVEAELANKGKK